MDNPGYIWLWRQFVDWEWYSDINCKCLFLHCLLKANYKTKDWHGIEIERGSFFTSIKSLSHELHLSEKQIRIALDKLKKTHEIDIKGASKGTYITICKYNDYQYKLIDEGEQKASEGQTEGEQKANKGRQHNKDNKDNKEKKIKIYSEQAHALFSDLVILFDEKLRPDTEAKKDKWLDVCEKLLKTGDHEHIKNIVKRARMDDFWSNNFLSLNKLIQTNKDGIKYFIVFENRFNEIQQKPKFVQ